MKNAAKQEVSKQLKRLVALTTMGCLLFVSVFTVSAFSKRVDIHDGSQIISVLTINTDTNKILKQANIDLNPDDLIFRVDNPDSSTEIVVKRAFDVSILVDGEIIPMKFVMGTVSDAILSSSVDIGENDAVIPDLHASLEPNMEILVDRRHKVTIHADGRSKDYCVPVGSSVSEALSFAEIPLYENDVLSKDVSETISDKMEISIERVGYRNKITTKSVPYKTIRKDADYLDEGVLQTSVKGINGESEVIIKETLVNGEVVKSEEVKNKVTLEPIDEVVLVGTKKKRQPVKISGSKSTSGALSNDKSATSKDSKGQSFSYSKVLTGSGTAYTAGSGALTSTGTTPRHGTVAVNPSIIPYGTRMYIVSTDGFVYGYARAEDTGGALRQGSALVDLYMSSNRECLNFGRRTVKVYILD